MNRYCASSFTLLCFYTRGTFLKVAPSGRRSSDCGGQLRTVNSLLHPVNKLGMIRVCGMQPLSWLKKPKWCSWVAMKRCLLKLSSQTSLSSLLWSFSLGPNVSAQYMTKYPGQPVQMPLPHSYIRANCSYLFFDITST